MDHAVAGVGPALVAGHDVRALGQRADDLALALVAPLGTHHDRTRHAEASTREKAAAHYATDAIGVHRPRASHCGDLRLTQGERALRLWRSPSGPGDRPAAT